MDKNKKAILFVGQAFYNHWYLSRELRFLGWKADLINIDKNNEGYYHGQDLSFSYTKEDQRFRLNTYLRGLEKYAVFHFANKGGIYFLNEFDEGSTKSKIANLMAGLAKHFLRKKSLKEILSILQKLRLASRDAAGELQLTGIGYRLYNKWVLQWLSVNHGRNWDIKLLKIAGKKIGYTNNGCLDGALKSSFSKWGPINTCKEVCKFYDQPQICSDGLNKEWGEYRNRVADYQCNLGNKVDYNDSPKVFESPWVYCLDTKIWNPDLLIPSNYLLPFGKEIVKIYHSVGEFESRSDAANKNIKCTHIYLDLIEGYKKEGMPVELIFFHGMPNKVIRYYQAQADIVVDMLTFGFFGANIREAMMLGKTTVCYLRPEWLETMRDEIPEYVEELPVVSATPETIDEILRELIANKEKREEIGRLSRDFAVKWHGSKNAAAYFNKFLPMAIDNEINKQTVFHIQEEIYN